MFGPVVFEREEAEVPVSEVAHQIHVCRKQSAMAPNW